MSLHFRQSYFNMTKYPNLHEKNSSSLQKNWNERSTFSLMFDLFLENLFFRLLSFQIRFGISTIYLLPHLVFIIPSTSFLTLIC